MKSLIISLALTLGLATSATAGGLTFVGGQVGVTTNTFLFPGVNATISGAYGAAAYDVDNSDWRLQIGGTAWNLANSVHFQDATLVVTKQTNANTRIGAYYGGIFFPGGTIGDIGLTAATQTKGGAFVEGELGTTLNGIQSAYVFGRYTRNRWFAEVSFVSIFGTAIAGAGAGYRFNLGQTANLDASYTFLTASGNTASRVSLDLSIPLGGKSDTANTNNRLIRHRNIFAAVGF